MTGRINGIQQERALRVCFAAVGRGARRDGFERKQEADALQWYSDAGKRGKHTRSLEHVVKLGIRISERWWGAVK